MLRIHNFECDECGVFEACIERDERHLPCPQCGEESVRIISAPRIHTLETHMRGYRDNSDGQWTPAHGEFLDQNLCDRKTGEPIAYSSPAEKRKRLEEQGLYEKPKTVRTTKRSERRMIFSKEGSKRSQLGIN